MSNAAFDLGSYGAEIVLSTTTFDQGMQNAENQMNNVDKKAKGFGSNLGTLAAGAVAGLGAALAGAAIAGVKMADDLDKALNGLQSATGTTDEEMQGMEESLKRIYQNNFGESFQDIADSMALVQQNTGLTGEALEETTTHALMLRDTFGKDIAESTLTANGLMNQFGLTSEEAFNLMAQGIQNGADKNGDFLEGLNEYGVHFEQLGFDASEFTNILIDGAQSGAFSVDKIGDAMKEFGIRSKDGSKASAEGFALLGLNAEDMTASFAAGGDTAQTAFQQVMDSLLAIEDPVAQNAAGVALFGTQFEDLGVRGIEAFANIGDNASLTKDSLGKINEVKYDSFGEAMSGIGRNLQMGLIEPVQKYVLPLLSDFANWITAHMPQIQETISTIFSAIGTVIGGFITVVRSVISTFNETETSTNSSFDNIKDTIDTILTTIKGIITDITSGIKVIWKKYGDDIVKYAKSSMENISNIISGVLKVIRGIVKTVMGLLTGDWDKAFLGLKMIVSGAFQAIEGVIKQSINASRVVIDTTLKVIKNVFSAGLNGVLSIASSIFNKVKSALTSPIESAKNTIVGIIEKIKGAFNFTWKLPKLKMPHVSVTMKENGWGIPYPDFDVSWWARGGIADKTLLYGVGEAGKEAIIPLDNPLYMAPFADAVFDRIMNRLKPNNPPLSNKTMNELVVHNNLTFNVTNKIDDSEIKKIANKVFSVTNDTFRARGGLGLI
ncbi:phage tail tape measure protein [Mesobacillus sp. S13]|uniref:phage tail tape measure protein n=1 Tax=Mesobacillus sp. S13 TaxID=2880221 RepID=UPI001CF0DC70|nr:phage tail tape measure protein [Mesobacillus sp. S13]